MSSGGIYKCQAFFNEPDRLVSGAIWIETVEICNMKIVKIIGGLGNQMFQYALLVALRETFREEILMDVSTFASYKLHNGFELERVFTITAQKATASEIQSLTHYTHNYRLSRIYRRLFPVKSTEKIENGRCRFDETVLIDDRSLYYDGIWQNYLYFDRFKDKIKQEFTYSIPLDDRNMKVEKDFRENLTVSLHIRRGDYLRHKNYIGLCGLDYYTAAVEYVKGKYGPDINFAVFSNDMPWCEEHILPMLGGRYLSVDWNIGMDSYKDMRLMSACRVNIIANSSFSWWAAYLNEHLDREIVAPKKWTNMPVEFNRQMPSWTLF